MKMKKIMFVLASILLMVLAVTSASAEVTLKQVQQSHFGGAEVIDFEDNLWESQSASFNDHTGKTSAILVNSYNRGDATTSSGEYSLFSNGNYPDTSANVPLTIEFEKGMSAVGFYLGNGNKYGEQVSAIVTAYGENGKILGMIAQNQLTDSVESFLGLEAPAEAIYKVTIDYGDSLLGEEIDDLMFIEESDLSSFTCSDPDGDNIFEKNTVTGLDSSKTSVLTTADYCTTKDGGAQTDKGAWVAEEQCDAQERAHTYYYECPNTHTCSDGACVVKEKPIPEVKKAPTCSDTDAGNDKFEKGVLTVYTPTWGNQVVHEYCADENRNNMYEGEYLEELVCLKNDATYAYEHVQVKCKYGCENGACRDKPEAPTPVAGSCVDRAILKGGNSLSLDDGVIGNVGQGDFYFLDRTNTKDGLKFWANNIGQQGLVDLGKVSGKLKDIIIPHYDVLEYPQNKQGFTRWEVPVVEGHVYAVLVEDGVSLFRVNERNDLSVKLEYLTSECTKKVSEKIYLYNKNDVNGVELEWNDPKGFGSKFDEYNVQWTADGWSKPANSYISFGSYYNLKNLDVGKTFEFKVCPTKNKVVVGECSNTIKVTIKGEKEIYNEIPKVVGPLGEKVPVNQVSICDNGCSYDGKCLPIGTRIKSDRPLYCNWEGKMFPQEQVGAVCENNFECSTNSCLSGQCNDLQKELSVQRSMLERIISWLNKLF